MEQTKCSVTSVSRLVRDLCDWMKSKDEFPCINAVPLDDNVLEWHCTICPDRGDYKSLIFHLIIYFGDEYPALPPKIKLCTSIPKSMVSGEWICLDMITKNVDDDFMTREYTITWILMQLEWFFLSQSSFGRKGHCRRMYLEAELSRFVCDKCNHCYDKPFPVTLSICKQLKLEQLDLKLNNHTRKIKCKDNQDNQDNQVNTRRIQNGVKCWFYGSLILKTKANGSDEYSNMLCLGLGITPVKAAGTTSLEAQLFGSDKIKKKIGHLQMFKCINPTFDLLSSDAFVKFSVRNAVSNDCKFTHFIPLFINEKHGEKAMKKMDKFVLKLWNVDKKNKQQECHPWLKLYTIANMMKSLIVSVMEHCDKKNKKNCDDDVISLNYSQNVLKTFYRLHHTLIAIYLRYKEELSPLLEYQIKKFFSKNKNSKKRFRNQECIPHLGVFLSYLTLWEKKEIGNKKYQWSDIMYELLDEIFIRQTKWVLNGHYGLIDAEYCSLDQRVLFYWKKNKLLHRLFMFNCFFFRECCFNDSNISLEEQFKLCNNNFGYLSSIDSDDDNDGLAYKFQEFVKRVYYNVSNYADFFDVIGIKYKGNVELGIWFLECMNESEYRGYHTRKDYVSKYRSYHPKRIDWIKQQQTQRVEKQQRKEKHQEREKMLKQRKEKQKQKLKQKQLEVEEEEKGKKEEKIKKKKDYRLPVEGSFYFSLMEDGIIFVGITQSSHEVASLDKMVFDYVFGGADDRTHIEVRLRMQRVSKNKHHKTKHHNYNLDNVECENSGSIYYADFSKNSDNYKVFKQIFNMSDIGLRVTGKYIDGGDFEFSDLSITERRIKRKLLRKQVADWWTRQLPQPKITSLDLEQGASRIKTVKSQVFDGCIKPELRPMVTFSIGTIKNGILSYNANQEIPLDCDTVRVFVRIVKNEKYGRQIKGFSRMYFDGEFKDLEYSNLDYDCGSVVYGPIIKDGSANDDDDDDYLVFYSDFRMKSLCRWFGNKLDNGISPRVRGLTMNGNEFYCCGGYDCIFYSNYEKKPVEQEILPQNRHRMRYGTSYMKIAEYMELPLCRGINVLTSVESDMQDLYEYVFQRHKKKTKVVTK